MEAKEPWALIKAQVRKKVDFNLINKRYKPWYKHNSVMILLLAKYPVVEVKCTYEAWINIFIIYYNYIIKEFK